MAAWIVRKARSARKVKVPMKLKEQGITKLWNIDFDEFELQP